MKKGRQEVFRSMCSNCAFPNRLKQCISGTVNTLERALLDMLSKLLGYCALFRQKGWLEVMEVLVGKAMELLHRNR